MFCRYAKTAHSDVEAVQYPTLSGISIVLSFPILFFHIVNPIRVTDISDLPQLDIPRRNMLVSEVGTS